MGLAQPGGKYDVEVRSVMESAKAHGVLLVVLGGDRGSGFSVATQPGAITPKDIVRVLREVANTIEKEGVD